MQIRSTKLFYFEKYFENTILFCIFKILFRSILHITVKSIITRVDKKLEWETVLRQWRNRWTIQNHVSKMLYECNYHSSRSIIVLTLTLYYFRKLCKPLALKRTALNRLANITLPDITPRSEHTQLYSPNEWQIHNRNINTNNQHNR